MGKLSFHFFTCLFNAVLVYIILINFLGWSGGYRDILGQTTNISGANWGNSYFGFQSLQMMLGEFNGMFSDDANNGSFTLNVLYNNIVDLVNTTFFGLPKVIGWIQGGKVNALDIFKLVFTLFAQPILIVIYTFLVIGHLAWYVLRILGVLLKAFSGAYNIPFDEIPDYHPTNNLIIPVPVLV